MASDLHKQEERELVSGREKRLGKTLHTFSTKVRSAKAPKRALEISGGAGAVLVPVGLVAIGGTIGIIVAVFGGLIAIAAWFLSARQPKTPPSTIIEVFEHGLVCSRGDASREIVWNEVVDVDTKKIPMPDGSPAIAVVFETVATAPLLIMVGGSFSDESETAKLLDSLRDVWVPIWCRRARVLAQQEDGLRVGGALIRCECLTVGDQKLAWSAVTGVHVVDGVDQLETTDGDKGVEGTGVTVPFPSAARRIAALAAAPPTPPLLPPAKPMDAVKD